ncbi:DUF4105 domain-containing protein [Xanthobacter autotrophicus DSM 431]|uniref:Lnb N-terminal periplasmic domain-containing protein n=1 Tax=Xanthobacter nonsaccharivorans TaxID=3119912 RepID=UPI0037262826
MADTHPGVATPAPRRRLRRAGAWLLLGLVLVPGTAWVLTALSFQAPERWRTLLMAVAGLTAVALVVLAWRRMALAWAGVAVAGLVAGVWWALIPPSNTRDWASDVARSLTAEVVGNEVILHNVRNFDWRTETDFTERWETRRYALDKLETVDLFSSVWGNPAIAHTLIGFGFADGQRVVLSIEIRKEKGESFSEIGGFFKEFELSMIAADESDIVRLRTDARGETVSIYPLKVTPDQARRLFLSYLDFANALAVTPQFYQTVTSNCTTVIYKLARIVDSRVPFDWRILLSGYLPDYLYAHSLIRTDLPLDQVKRQAVIRRQGHGGEPFSQAIRAP